MKKQSLLDVAKDTEPNKPETCEIKESRDDCCMTYYGKEIETVEELLESAKIDLSIWEVVEQSVNNWEVAGKRRMGQGEAGRWNADQLWKTGLRQIKVKLRRRAPKPIQDAIKDLLKNVKPLATKKPPRAAKSGRHMMEIGLHDVHLAKLCYGVETGTNYDLKIAEKEYRSAIDEMLGRSTGFNVNKITLPVGGDFLHFNSEDKMTANFTPMATSADDRLSKVWRAGCSAMQYAVERCLEVAPVELVYIAGNHDRTSSLYISEWLAAKFDHNKSVSILNGPSHRKYISYGPSLLGYTHGDEVPADRLPQLMATEAPHQWAASRFRSWRTGHWHKRKSTRFNVGDTHGGVEVYVFPSLCGTDSWHYRKGFVGNARMAEVHFWSETDGPVGNFIVHAKEPLVPIVN